MRTKGIVRTEATKLQTAEIQKWALLLGQIPSLRTGQSWLLFPKAHPLPRLSGLLSVGTALGWRKCFLPPPPCSTFMHSQAWPFFSLSSIPILHIIKAKSFGCLGWENFTFCFCETYLKIDACAKNTCNVNLPQNDWFFHNSEKEEVAQRCHLSAYNLG